MTSDNILFGTSSNDYIFGDFGNDQLFGDAGFDFLDGGPGHDQLFGGAGSDFLYGGYDDIFFYVDDDDLDNGADNNSMNIDIAPDELTGGSGADYFIIDTYSSFVGLESVDVIKDFNAPEGDLILFDFEFLLIEDILSGVDPVSESISDFITMTQDSGDTILSYDRDGAETERSPQAIAIVEGVTDLTYDSIVFSPPSGAPAEF